MIADALSDGPPRRSRLLVPPFFGPSSAAVRPLLRVALAAPNRLTAPPFPAIVGEPVSTPEPDVDDFAFDASPGLLSVGETTDIDMTPPVVPVVPEWQGTPDWATPVVEATEAVWPVRTTPVLVTPVTMTPIDQAAIIDEGRAPTPVTFRAVPDVGDSCRAVAEALESLAAQVRRGELAIAGAVPEGDVSAAVAAALAALLGVRAAS